MSVVASLIEVNDATAISNVGTHKLMALVSNTQMNVEHNAELFALAVAFYKSQSQTLTICSTTSLATECQTRCLRKSMRVRPLLPNGINFPLVHCERFVKQFVEWLFFFDFMLSLSFSLLMERDFLLIQSFTILSILLSNKDMQVNV